jgi:hypothetical protein
VASLFVACAPSPPAPATPSTGVAAAESAYADLRALRDRYDVTTASGLTATTEGEPLPALAKRHDALRSAVAARLASCGSRARLHLRRRGHRGIAARSRLPSQTHLRLLGWAQHRIVVGDDTLDRLSVLGKIAREADSSRRRALFLALSPTWKSINGDNRTDTPYRALTGLEVRQRKGQAPSPVRQARASGLPPDSLEPWLYRVLATWGDATRDSLLEPWDWLYAAGEASRALSPRISAARLKELDAEVYRALGADVSALRVHYDLAPREGKTPVAYTTFGARARLRGDRWTPGEPWIFATYREGGLDNLTELLHETGHAIHIAAIRTRPAFADWPDSDPFSEALGDFVALDFAEPVWQQRWLGDSVPLVEGLRAKYAGIVLDVAWALFETQMLRDPTQDPNDVWTRLTSAYLHIRPHPELSW